MGAVFSVSGQLVFESRESRVVGREGVLPAISRTIVLVFRKKRGGFMGGLGVANCELLTAEWELRVENCYLRVTDC